MDNAKKAGFVHAYVARFPFEADDQEITPARAEEIESCSNAEVRRQKFYVWKLLERALLQSSGLKISELEISRSASGKWECAECFFSLSHSGNFVAVAVSDEPVGIDIERLNLSRFTPALAEKIATEREKADISPQALNELWTKKEAIFKLSGDRVFSPKKIDVSDYVTVTKTVRCNGESYIVSVASENARDVNFYISIKPFNE